MWNGNGNLRFSLKMATTDLLSLSDISRLVVALSDSTMPFPFIMCFGQRDQNNCVASLKIKTSPSPSSSFSKLFINQTK